MTAFLFILACVLLFALVYLGFIPRDFTDTIALVYLAVTMNAMISIITLGVLCFG